MMATIDIDDADYIFECPVCFEQIDDTWRMLSCQHTFCSGCLEKLYEFKQNPQCPTCREVIAVSIESIELLQRPEILLSLYEKYRVGGKKNHEKKDESSATELSEETILVKLESVGSDDQQEDTYQSNPVSDMATMMQSCTFQSDSDQLESHPVQSDSLGSSSHSTPIPEPTLNNNTEGVMIQVDERITIGVLEDTSIAPLDVSDLLISHGENNNLTSRLHVPDLSNYLRINPPKFVLNTVMLETMDENKLYSLEKFKILEYLDFINDHLNALKLYRRDKILEMTENDNENREIVEHILSLDNPDDTRPRDNAQIVAQIEDDEEGDDDLRLALEMSRQTYIQTNGDVLFDIALKKSEILDPIDSLQICFRNIRERLELRKSVIESMGLI